MIESPVIHIERCQLPTVPTVCKSFDSHLAGSYQQNSSKNEIPPAALFTLARFHFVHSLFFF